MRRLLFASLIFTTGFLFSAKVNAQQKIGYFNEERTLRLFSELSSLDSVMNQYRIDSIGKEFERRSNEVVIGDSLYKKNCGTPADSAKTSCLVAKQAVDAKRDTLSNWYNYAQGLSANKLSRILFPYRIKMAAALQEVIAERKYTYVLDIATFSPYFTPPIGDNLCIRVGMKLNLPFGKKIIDQMNAADAKEAKAAAPKPSSAPVKKK